MIAIPTMVVVARVAQLAARLVSADGVQEDRLEPLLLAQR